MSWNYVPCCWWNSVWFTVRVSHVVWRPLAKCQEVWYNRFLGQAHPIKLSWTRPDALAQAKSWGSRLNLQYDVTAAPDLHKSSGLTLWQEKTGKWEKFHINQQLEEIRQNMVVAWNSWMIELKAIIFWTFLGNLMRVPFLSCVRYNNHMHYHGALSKNTPTCLTITATKSWQ